MANIVWGNGFGVFEAPCRLDCSIFQAPAQNGLTTMVGRFYTWLNTLRTEVEAASVGGGTGTCGIPGDRVTYVMHLLDTFFPINGRVDISCHPGDYANIRDPDPVTVPWGPNNRDLKIIDGPAALGYIFSVATPPNGATYDNYLVPLQAIYSRCLYLAYIRKIGNPEPVNNVGDPPAMSSCIYFRDADNQLWFLLGSTYILTYAVDGSDTADHNAKRRLMNGWRREQILNPALQSYNPNRRLPPIPHVLPPVLELAVAEAIWKSLFNTPLGIDNAITYNTNLPALDPWITVPENLADAQFQLVRTAVNAAWRAVPNPQDLVPFPRTGHWDRGPFKNALRAALLNVVRLRWELGINRNDIAIQAAYRQVFDIVFVPRMFQPTANNKPNTLLPEFDPGQVLPNYMALKDTLFATLYGPANTSPVLRMLDNLYTWVNNGNDYLAFAGPSVQRYGRCAETYPIAGRITHQNELFQVHPIHPKFADSQWRSGSLTIVSTE
ncbi:hypothetical protein M441DRAFT_151457 [Trichoderma asperellum CBS 433.97]|uniref:Uncharacterized protein n=1 Tax=Trichoderma asperellum (strain ATCC 204424 / CBS 433.97 / NBRC 101777) TaxID=1042311 RepID=A0A2T3YU97_TRIA4|nr:hypothetical protein M441DRAFT_151457 [Trichoderma asperellum CBS 433.97]PTB36135.1 hypothetical protein M441DRAFT_151457 [Trichoderma asperellum CBS 433.97]